MRSSFFGLNTLLRALEAQQQALDTTNHNIANANTEGYSRQLANMTATTPYTLPAQNRPAGVPLQIGTGVVVNQVKRQRDAFVDLELRQQSEKQSRWEALANGLQQVEGIFNEPGDNSIQKLATDFFNSWSELSNNPASTALRTVVRSNGDALTVQFNDVAKRLLSTRQDIDAAITAKVPEINDLGAQLAALNDQILKSLSVGDIPNDLRDKRDLILDQLSSLTGATYREEARGSTTVLIGGRVFVNGAQVNTITTESSTVASGVVLHNLKWQFDGVPVTIEGGTMQGQLELRDTRIPEKIKQLNMLATSIAFAVNKMHRGGVGLDLTTTNQNFFDPMMNGASTLNSTGLGDEVTAGTFTINGPGGTQTVSINTTQDTIDSVLTKIQQAVVAAGGAGTTASATVDATTGKFLIQYTKAGGAPSISFGSSGDTSNFLQVVGLQGAPKVISGNNGTILGLEAVPIIRAAGMSLDPSIKTSVNNIATAPVGFFVDPVSASDLVPSKGIEGFITSAGTPPTGNFRLAVTPVTATTYDISLTDVVNGTTVTLAGQTRPATGTQATLTFNMGAYSVDVRVNSNVGASTIAAGSGIPNSQFEFIGTAGGTGDNRIAMAVAQLQRTRFDSIDNATFADYYASNIGQLGVETRQAEQIGENEKLLAQHLEQRRQSVSGVSLDEEATQLIKYQRAYQAAARGISAVDEMLDTIISHMGRVGA